MPKRKILEVLISDLISMKILMTKADFELYLINNHISCNKLDILYNFYIKKILM